MQDDRAFCSKLSLEISQPRLGITAKSGAMLGLAVEVNKKRQTHDADLLEQLGKASPPMHRILSAIARTAQRTVMPACTQRSAHLPPGQQRSATISLIAFGLQSLQLSVKWPGTVIVPKGRHWSYGVRLDHCV